MCSQNSGEKSSQDEKIGKNNGDRDDKNDSNNNTGRNAKLDQIERDILAKQRGPNSPLNRKKPGVESVVSPRSTTSNKKSIPTLTNQKLDQLEQDVVAKRTGRPNTTDITSITTPGVVGVVSSSKQTLEQMEQEVTAKRKAKSIIPASTPGVVGVVSSTKQSLEQVEQELVAKRKGKSSSSPSATTPGAVSSSSIQTLEQMELKIASSPKKEKGGKSVVTAVAAAGPVSSSINSNNKTLDQLEQDALAKQQACSSKKKDVTTTVSVNTDLTDLETRINSKLVQGSCTKSPTRSSTTTTVHNLDRRIANKIQARNPQTELSDVETRIHSKLTSSQGTSGSTRISITDLENQVNGASISKGLDLKQLQQQQQQQESTDELLYRRMVQTPTPRNLLDAEHYITRTNFTEEEENENDRKNKRRGLDNNNNNYDSDYDDAEYGIQNGGEDLAVAVAIEEEDNDDSYLPSAIEYDPDAKPPIYRNRRFRLYLLLFVAALLIGMIGALMGMLLSNNNNEPNAIPYRETIGIRENLEVIFGKEVFMDRSSPYKKALDWITHEDEMAITTENPLLFQRFTAAYLYYATSLLHPWEGGCNKAEDGENKIDCEYLFMEKTVPDPVFSRYKVKRWLSIESECTWAGMHCNEFGQINTINFSGANMTGTFPEGIVKGFPFLQFLRLRFGQLQGPIPEYISELKHLTFLDLEGNQFIGTIPDTLYNLRVVDTLIISNNKIAGPISSKISQLHSMKMLKMRDNLLEGNIPTEFGELKSTQWLEIDSNQLNGTIPTEFGQIRELWNLFLHRNKLTGGIPTEIGKISTLQDLRLHINHLNGTIPEEIYTLDELLALDLYDNSFTGALSTSVGKVTNLNLLRINGNDISGTIPTELGLITDLRIVDLSGTDLVGEMPLEVCANRHSNFAELNADCYAESDTVPEVSCPAGCCTSCCDSYGENCKVMIQG